MQRKFLIGLRLATGLALLGTAGSAMATDPACLSHPSSVIITYGGQNIAPYSSRINQIIPGYCVAFEYGGGPLWTTMVGGGISCNGDQVRVDYRTANHAFNNFRIHTDAPAACGPAQAAPAGPPPELTAGGRVNMYYGPSTDMYSAPVMAVSAACYKINYGGNVMWFPKSALAYRTELRGRPPGLDYNARRDSAC
jgi:hypothetical protein